MATGSSSFISEGINMNKSKKDNTNILQWIIPSIILVLFLVVTLFNYSAEIESQIRERVDEKQELRTSNMGEYYEKSIEALMSVASVTAGNISKEKDIFSDDVQVMLSEAVRNTIATDAIVIKMDGSSINSKGRESVLGEKLDLTELLDGKTHVSDLFQYTSDQTFHALIAAPVKTENAMMGVVAIIMPFDHLGDITSSAAYSVKNTYGILRGDGIVVERSGNLRTILEVGKNGLTDLESAEIVDGTYKKMLQNTEANKGGKIIFNSQGKLMDAGAYYLYYEPIGEYGWYTATVVPYVQIEKVIRDERKTTTDLITKMIVAMLIFVAILVAINVITRARYIKESKELQDKAETDLLTDLLNKIATEKRIREYLENEGKDKRSIMFVLDIDNFKKINDTMGHAFGDEVLSTLGRRIKSEFRINDIVGRTGGDEFVVLLKDLKDEDTMKKEADRVATFFKNFQVGEYVKYYATASIGAAIYPENAKDFDTLYKAADNALYKAKHRGKNQLAFYDESMMTEADNEATSDESTEKTIEQNV